MLIRYIVIWFIVVGFIPNNARLIEPIKPEGTKAIQYKDIDDDGEKEIIATYKIVGDVPEVNVIILKKYDKKWFVSQLLKSKGYAVEQVSFQDIDNDGKEEVLFGSKLGGTWNNISVYKAVNNKFSRIYNNIYSELKIQSY